MGDINRGVLHVGEECPICFWEKDAPSFIYCPDQKTSELLVCDGCGSNFKVNDDICNIRARYKAELRRLHLTENLPP